MECLGAQYYDSLTQLCKSCHSDCRRCTGPGKFSCSACSLPLHLDKLNNQCVPCCTGSEKGPQAEECCLCDPETGENPSRRENHDHFKMTRKLSECRLSLMFAGGCTNSSPAGKRRVPGTEFLDNSAVLPEAYENGRTSSNNDSATLAVTAATTMAVAICLASVALFVSIFLALQVSNQ